VSTLAAGEGDRARAAARKGSGRRAVLPGRAAATTAATQPGVCGGVAVRCCAHRYELYAGARTAPDRANSTRKTLLLHSPRRLDMQNRSGSR